MIEVASKEKGGSADGECYIDVTSYADTYRKEIRRRHVLTMR